MSHIGVLTIHVDGSISHENIDEVPNDPNFSSEILNYTYGKVYYIDKEMHNFINEKYYSLSDKFSKIIGKTDFPLNIFKLDTIIKDSKKALSRSCENILCNLVTDALRYYGNADITIMNAGSIRVGINKGNFTVQDIINASPFSDQIITKEITGQAILDALEHGVRKLPEPSPTFPQVSGITYKIEMSIPSQVVLDENQNYVRLDGERRVYGVMINGEELDLNKKYTISTNGFFLGGGDGYSMMTPFEVKKSSIGVDNEIIIKYVENHLDGIIPVKYQKPEGRIVKTLERKIIPYIDEYDLTNLVTFKMDEEIESIKFNNYF